MPHAFGPKSEGPTYVAQSTDVTVNLARCKVDGHGRKTRMPIDAPQKTGRLQSPSQPGAHRCCSICASDAVCRIGILLDLCYIGVRKPD